MHTQGNKLLQKPSNGTPLKPATPATAQSQGHALPKRSPVKLASMVTELDDVAPVATAKPLPTVNHQPLKLASMASIDLLDPLLAKAGLDVLAPMKPLGVPVSGRGQLPRANASGHIAGKTLLPQGGMEPGAAVSRAKLGGPLSRTSLSRVPCPDPLAEPPRAQMEMVRANSIRPAKNSLSPACSDEFPESVGSDTVSLLSSDGSSCGPKRHSSDRMPLPPLGKPPSPSPRTARILRHSMTSGTVRAAAGKELLTGRALLKLQSA